MLAYVFWHWQISTTAASTYEASLINFHQTLSAHKPDGFHYTRTLRMEQASWLDRNETTYEDWHLVENSAALDPLNEQAVNGPCQEPHRQIASLTQNGTGGLYSLISGAVELPTINFAYRFSKPTTMTYATLYALLQSATEEAKTMLWTRQMSLGPGPEFCLHSSEELILPNNVPTQKIPVQQILSTS